MFSIIAGVIYLNGEITFEISKILPDIDNFVDLLDFKWLRKTNRDNKLAISNKLFE